jgi:hypothetical protein
LKELASLDPKKLAVNLPALRIVSEQPLSKVSPAPAELRSIAYNLAKVNPTTDDYWRTVLQFIQFASAHYAPNAPPPGSRVNFELKASRINHAIKFPPHSGVSIDGVAIENETFTDSRIIFTGIPSVIKNVQFINYAFEFPTVNKPSSYLEATGRELPSGIQSATIAGL